MKDKISLLLSSLVPLKKEEIEKLIEIPKNLDLGDYAFPCFILAKKLKKNPAQIAEEISKKIKSQNFEKIKSIGPYINFSIDRKLIASQVLKKILKEKDKYGSHDVKGKVVLEFPSPNTNKPLHIGHARNIILGQSVKKILEFYGGNVKIVNLNNDRGIHICKSMVAYAKFGKADSPQKAKKKSDHFIGDYYVLFSQKAKENPSLEKEAQDCLQRWESRDKKITALWKKMNSWAFSGFKETYKKFGYKASKEYFESKIYKEGKNIINKGLKNGILKKKEDGAVFADLKDEGLGEKILLRADGTSIYITQDLYLALLRYKELSFDKSIYVSASEQNHHFKTLFAILKLLGFKWASRLYHLNYGMVNLESGRMKSREGNVVDADDLIAEMEYLALKELDSRYKDLLKKEKLMRAEAIAMAALRYYFLKIDRAKDIIFKPEESISFEGDTGSYLLYTYARARSILRKADYKPKKFEIKKINDKEKALIISLSAFPEIAEHAYSELNPSLIAHYSYNISQMFNEFYHSSQVIGSQEENFRLTLVSAFAYVLKNALSLLGIQVIEKM